MVVGCFISVLREGQNRIKRNKVKAARGLDAVMGPRGMGHLKWKPREPRWKFDGWKFDGFKLENTLRHGRITFWDRFFGLCIWLYWDLWGIEKNLIILGHIKQ